MAAAKASPAGSARSTVAASAKGSQASILGFMVEGDGWGRGKVPGPEAGGTRVSPRKIPNAKDRARELRRRRVDALDYGLIPRICFSLRDSEHMNTKVLEERESLLDRELEAK